MPRLWNQRGDSFCIYVNVVWKHHLLGFLEAEYKGHTSKPAAKLSSRTAAFLKDVVVVSRHSPRPRDPYLLSNYKERPSHQQVVSIKGPQSCRPVLAASTSSFLYLSFSNQIEGAQKYFEEKAMSVAAFASSLHATPLRVY